MKKEKVNIEYLNLDDFREQLNHLSNRWRFYLSQKSITALIHFLKGYKTKTDNKKFLADFMSFEYWISQKHKTEWEKSQANIDLVYLDLGNQDQQLAFDLFFEDWNTYKISAVLREQIEQSWIKAYNSIDKKIMDDIYTFSFWVYKVDDDPRSPALTIGFNTNSNLQAQISNASDELEAKWNFAYWLQNEIASIGTTSDSIGRVKISTWITDLGLNYSDEEKDEDFDSCMERGEKISEGFINMLIDIVKTHHCSKPSELPILIHELEYNDRIRDQNIRANGKEKVKEFSKWINDM